MMMVMVMVLYWRGVLWIIQTCVFFSRTNQAILTLARAPMASGPHRTWPEARAAPAGTSAGPAVVVVPWW